MAWYYQGSVTITPGSNVVTGTGTQWLANLYGIGEGQALVIGLERLEIMYVDSDTSLRLALPHTAGYSGSYHIETSYAGTGGDASRQIMACIRRFSTLVVDWNEWMTSTADTMTATDPFGNPVEIATYHAFSKGAGFKDELALQGYTVKDAEGNDVVINPLKDTQGGLKTITDTINKVEPASVIFNRDVLAKEIGVGYPRAGTSPSTRFGYHNASATTPRLYMADGNAGKTIQFPFDDGTMASREWVNKMVYVGSGNTTYVKNPANARLCLVTNDAGEAGGYDMANGRWAFVHNQAGFKVFGTGEFLSSGDYASVVLKKSDGRFVQIETSPHAGSLNMLNFIYRIPGGANQHVMSLPYETGSIASREWVNNYTGWGISNAWAPMLTDHNLVTTYTGTYYYGNTTANKPATSVGFGAAIVTRYSADISHHLYINNYGSSVLAVRRMNGASREDYYVLTSNNYTVDGNGFYKKASPIVTINANGYTTNRESRGATVRKLAVGQYQICNILGYNDDGAWGVNGGIVVPKDNNGLQLVFVKDRVQADGSIVVTTYHRQHAHLPEAFQNHRIKEIVDGVPVYMQDGEQCDLPAYTRLDVRVGMPEGCIWNKQQYWNNVYLEYCTLCRAQQSALSNETLALPLL